jgi:hypothetical protein
VRLIPLLAQPSHLLGLSLMNSVSSLTRASFAALDGLGRAIEQIERSALRVASRPGELSFGRQFTAFVQLQNARVEAASNAAVLRIVNSPYHELLRLPRL